MRVTVASCGNPVRQSPQYLKDDTPDDDSFVLRLLALSHALILICFLVDAGIRPCQRRLLTIADSSDLRPVSLFGIHQSMDLNSS